MFSEPKNPKKKAPQWNISEDKVFEFAEFKQLRKTCKNLKRQGIKDEIFSLVRDWLTIELGLYTGLRVEEMTLLKIKDLLVSGEHSSVFVRKGKGEKQRNVRISCFFKQECREFLKIREQFGLTNNDEDFILTSAKGKNLTTRALQKAFKRCAKKAGLPDRYSIHNMRHTYSTYLLQASGDVRLVQLQLGHASLLTTQKYLWLIERSTKLAVENLYRFPSKINKL